MHDEFDQVGRALASLRSEKRTFEHHKLELEEILMQGFDNHTGNNRFAKYRTLIVSLVVVLIGGGVFAATGGVQKVRRFFVTVELLGTDGSQNVGLLLERLNEEPIELQIGGWSEATVIFEPDGDEDGEATIEMHFAVDGDAVGVQTQTTSHGELNFGTVEIQSGDDDQTDTSQVLLRKLGMTKSGFDLRRIIAESLNVKGLARRIDAADVLETWTTDDGRTRELYVLPALDAAAGSESGLQIVIVTEDLTGERIAQLVGSISGVDPATTKLTDLSWNDGTAAALSFVKADGGELTVEILTSDEALDGNDGAIRVTLRREEAQSRVKLRKFGRSRD